MINPDLKNSAILIIDDQEANIDILRDFLEVQGYTRLNSTQDPFQITRLLSEFDPDLILLDLFMPGLSGYEVMNVIKSIVPVNTFLPILVLTADITQEAKQKALSGGATDFLTKPIDLTEVGLRIHNLLYTRFLHLQLLEHNQLLEEKVKYRTAELEKMNIELLNAKEKAEAADQLKSAFINQISHEIRTPLNSILGFGQLLTEPGLQQNDKNKYLAMMKISSARLINLITNFIDISLINKKEQRISKKETDLEQLIREVAGHFAEFTASKGIALKIEYTCTNTGYLLISDPELLRKVLWQVMDNAVKFTPKGSISVGCRFNDDQIVVYIKDTGIGISGEKQEMIFGNFSQEDESNTRKFEGCGLGLPIAKGFIGLLGGKIWLESEKEVGSTFYFSLPVEKKLSSPEPSDSGNFAAQPGKITMLIAEDDEFNFLYISMLLASDYIGILHARNGAEAVSYFRSRPDIRIVLMDLKMPVMDGFEATREIRNIRKDIPVIAVSAYAGLEDKQKAFMAGCNDFLTKPVDKELLFRMLDRFGIVMPEL